MKHILLAATLLTLATPGRAQNLPDPLVAAVRDYQHAIVAHDKATLERLTARDFLMIDPDGFSSLRPEALQGMLDANRRIQPLTGDMPMQRSWASGAVLGGLFHIRGTDHGKPVDVRREATSVWALEKGAWQILFLKIDYPSTHAKELIAR